MAEHASDHGKPSYRRLILGLVRGHELQLIGIEIASRVSGKFMMVHVFKNCRNTGKRRRHCYEQCELGVVFGVQRI
jgi:hypothetical protein